MRVHAGVEWRLRVGCRKSCLCCDRCGEARKAAVVTTCVRQGMCLQQVACVQQETCTRWGDVRAAGDELVSWGGARTTGACVLQVGREYIWVRSCGRCPARRRACGRDRAQSRGACAQQAKRV
jgi:hypothetical protein